MTPLLSAQEVAFPGRLEPTRIDLAAGSLTALIGPNGGGKTSLLRALAGVEESLGQIAIDGERLRDAAPARRARMVAFLPASRDLPWPIRARDLIALGPVPASEQTIQQMVTAFELEPLVERPVNHLSTGERARVLLARVLASEARLLLLDEPLSNLDPYWVIRTLQLLGEARRAGRTVLLSLHDLAQLDSFDRVLLLDGGRVTKDSAPVDMIRSEALSQAFRIRRSNGAWAVSPAAGRRSSP